MAATKDTAAALVEASGAIVEKEIIEGVELAHPAVDDNPRANATADAVRIDFNDPGLTSAEAVEANLKAA